MDIKELQPIITLISESEERVVKKISGAIDLLKEQNGRVTELEKKEIIRAYREDRLKKNKVYYYATQVVIAAIGAAMIIKYGVLEIFKAIK